MATHYQIIYDSSLSVTGVADTNKITLGVNSSLLEVTRNVDGTDKSYQLYLKKIEYDKQINQCGKVTLTFQTSSTPDDLSTFRLALEDFVAEKNKISVTVGENYIALGYDIFSAKIRTAVGYSGTSLTNIYEVVMQCYSPEHTYAIHPASRAWTGKPFSSNIVRNILEGYSDATDDKDTGFPAVSSLDAMTNHCILTPDKLSYLQYSKKETTTKSDGSSEEKTTVIEANQPYLVQYNESFYDFACRTANRCGEFLYHEDGCLRIGLPAYTLSKIGTAPTAADNATGKPQPLIEFGEIIEAPDEPAIYSDSYFDDSTYGTAGTYNGNVTDDAYLTRLDPSTDVPQDLFGWWMVIDAVNSYVQEMIFQDSLSEMLSNVAENVTLSAIIGAYAKSDFTKTYVKDDDADDKFNTGLGLDGTQLTNLADALKNTFYEKLHRQMSAQTARKVNLNYQNTMHTLRLGQCVYITELGQTWHIVTRIHGSLSKTGASDKGAFSHEVEIIPVAGGKAVPPLDAAHPCIHKAEPQEAVVIANDDPLFMGRVRVRYMWQPKTVHSTTTDNDGNTVSDPQNLTTTEGITPWIRVSTPFAGAKGEDVGGMYMTPCLGSHVMINHMHDNIELPYVDGALYTSSTKPGRGYMAMLKSFLLPSYPLRVIGSASGHTISFLDGVDAQNFTNGMVPLVKLVWSSVLQAKLDSTNRNKKKSDEDEKEAAARPSTLAGGMVLKDEQGIYEINMSTQNRNITINSPIGTVNLNAFTGITISAPNGDINITGKNVNITAGNNLTLKSGAHIQSADSLSGSSISGLVGSCLGKYAAASATAALMSATLLDVSKLCDLKFLRAVTETIFRPVEGTLSLQSNRNVVMTSGKGKVTIPKSLMSTADKYQVGKKATAWNKTDAAYQANIYQRVVPVLNAITLKIRQRLTDVQNASAELTAALNGIHKLPQATVDAFGKDDKKALITAEHHDSFIVDANRRSDVLTILDWFKASITTEQQKLVYTYKRKKTNKYVYKTETVITQVGSTKVPRFIAEMNNAIQKYDALIRVIKGLSPADALPDKNMDIIQPLKTAIDEIVTQYGDDAKDFDAKYTFASDAIHVPTIRQGLYSFQMDQSIDQIIKNYLYTVIKSSSLFDEKKFRGSADEWAAFIDSITLKSDSAATSFFAEMGTAAAGFVGLNIDTDGNSDFGKLTNWNGQGGPRAMWETGGQGGILISNNAGKTYKLKKDGNGWEDIDNPGLNILKDFLSNQNTNMVDRVGAYINDI